MNVDTLSSRNREGPLVCRNREVPTDNCLEVQWRFLQHKNPQRPHFGSPARKLLPHDPSKPRAFSGNSAHSLTSRTSPSRLFHMFEAQDVEAEETHTTPPISDLPENSRASQTLNDLMGETQRQAMLDRILADMEYLAVEPKHLRLGQTEDERGLKVSSPRHAQRTSLHKPPIHKVLQNESILPEGNNVQPKQRRPSLDSDLNDDDDSLEDAYCGKIGHNVRKSRRGRMLQQLDQKDKEPRVFWRKTTRANLAADVPERLLTLIPSPPHREKSAHMVVGQPSHSLVISDCRRETPMCNSTNSQLRSQPATNTTVSDYTFSPRRRQRHHMCKPAASSSPSCTSLLVSPPKATYGAWYIPRSEWWRLHQLKQPIIVDKLPTSTTDPTDETHCHSVRASSSQCQHKPPLPSNARSPRSNRNPQPPIGHRNTSKKSSIAPSFAPGLLELEVADIPQSYIGHKYRAYVMSTGSTMPHYLQ